MTVDEKLTWTQHMLELKKSFVKKLGLLKKSRFLPRNVRQELYFKGHLAFSDLWSYTMGILLQFRLISVPGKTSLQGCETYLSFAERHGIC